MTIYIDSSHLGTLKAEATQRATGGVDQAAISEAAKEKPTPALAAVAVDDEAAELDALWRKFVVAPVRAAAAAFAAGVVP